MIGIRKAEKTEYEYVRAFYYRLIDDMRSAEYKPGWEKGVYPSDEYLRDAIDGGELYLGFAEGEIAAAMIVDQSSNESYAKARWELDIGGGDYAVIHALGVLPKFSGRGYAKIMVRKALELAAGIGCKAVRLDVLNGNLPAERLYSGLGFKHTDTIQMYYEDTGWTDFLLYEHPIDQGENMQTKIKEYIYSHKDEMLSVLSELIAIPSVRGEAEEDAPFGREPKRALDKMLELCAGMGFQTSCCENVVGSAEHNPSGDEVALGILCHLDVVSAQPESWATDPFELTERDGVLYGRGAIDDKGPAAAALYAVRCVKELGIPLKKGVRLIFGTDEENGSSDMDIYKKHEKLPPNVFTPDGSFPVINVEKGMMRSAFGGKYEGGSVRIFRGGSIPNAVPDNAFAGVEGVTLSEINAAIEADKSGAVFTAEEIDGVVRIKAAGRSAHASTPESGINAVTALITLLNRLPLKDGRQAEILRGLERAFPFGETDGFSAGLKAEDKTGAATLVFSIFRMENGECEGTIDVRFPTCLDLKTVEEKERAALSAAGCEFKGFIGDEPHCVDESSEFVQALLRVYERIEGEKGECIAIGGGTYVHNIEGGVAFGVERGDTDYHMHGADEFITAEELLKDAVLFANVIVEICG